MSGQLLPVKIRFRWAVLSGKKNHVRSDFHEVRSVNIDASQEEDRKFKKGALFPLDLIPRVSKQKHSVDSVDDEQMR